MPAFNAVNTRPWNLTDVRRLKHLWSEGKSLGEICFQLGRSEAAVLKKRADLKLQPRHRLGIKLLLALGVLLAGSLESIANHSWGVKDADARQYFHLWKHHRRTIGRRIYFDPVTGRMATETSASGPVPSWERPIGVSRR